MRSDQHAKGLAGAWTTREVDVTHFVCEALLAKHGNRPLSKSCDENGFGSGLQVGSHDDRREE